MIKGLRLRMASVELRKHCETRSAHHRTRAEEKTKEIPALKEAMERIKKMGGSITEIAKFSKSMSNYNVDQEDPVEALEKDIHAHIGKSLVFGFFASHLFDEDYDLDENDLRRLELIK